MLSVNGFTTNNLTTTGLYNIDADEINADSVNCDTFLNQSSSLFTGVSSNLQTQINTINSLVSTGSTGGGYFSILATQNSGFIASSYWGYSSGTNPTVNNPLVFGYNFKVTSITFICQTIPTTSAQVRLYKNGSSVYTMDPINATSKTFSNINVEFLAGDTFNIFTQSGAGGTMIRATISCQVGGVTGATPQLSVGTVSNLAYGSTGQTGATGATGATGQKGDTGSQGPKGDKGDKGDTDASGLASGLLALGASGITAILSALGLATVAGDVTTLQGQVSGLEGDVSTLNDEVSALEGKTQYITTDTATVTTQITSNFQVGTAINPSSFNINYTTGDLANTGDVTIKNDSGGSTITLGANTGTIAGNQISCSSGNIDTITTSSTQTQNIYGSTVNIGTTGINTVNIGSSTSAVYINGLIYLPFSSASSFFSQW
ncbi:hypothetical protein EBU95_16360 [bacterium]|nr:hypothetical protein [bacterium]